MPRNTGGLYSLPPGNPVQGGTAITTTWANSTLSDLGAELTSSLSRDGYGGMRAPLKLPQGSAPLPAVTFTADPASGLYLAGSGSDVRMSVASTDIQTWTVSAISTSKPLTVTGNITSSATVQGVTGVFTGGATGSGVTGTGGASSGVGVTGVGGATNGYGGNFTGTGSGAGLLATGGATNGKGVVARGIGTGIAVDALSTDGVGVYSIGGNGFPGVEGIGGAAGGAGVRGFGGSGTTAPGGWFFAGTAATAGTPQTAVRLDNGYLSLDGVTAPASTTAVKNAVTPSNIVKAWALIRTTGLGGVSVVKGFNIASVALSSGNVVVTFASPFTDANYAANVSVDDMHHVRVQAKTASTCTIDAFEFNAGASSYLDINLSTSADDIDLVVVGQQ